MNIEKGVGMPESRRKDLPSASRAGSRIMYDEDPASSS
jgi:hypothetical protein